ncbi:MAG: hypothetical protein J7530_15465 [Novosphingobium sp.]|nr:hypothetical protein [Novosphingobium sp.]
MRPNSIVQFDRFYLGSLVLAVINSALSMQDTLSDPRIASSGLGLGFLVGAQVFSFALILLLWFFISRNASNVAKWILTVLTVAGVLMTIPTLPALAGRGLLGTGAVVVITALQIVAVVFLFRPDAKAWFARKGDVAADDESIFS